MGNGCLALGEDAFMAGSMLSWERAADIVGINLSRVESVVK